MDDTETATTADKPNAPRHLADCLKELDSLAFLGRGKPLTTDQRARVQKRLASFASLKIRYQKQRDAATSIAARLKVEMSLAALDDSTTRLEKLLTA